MGSDPRLPGFRSPATTYGVLLGTGFSGGRAIGIGASLGFGRATGGVAGFGSAIISRTASFTTALSRYWERIVSQIRRASSNRFFAFSVGNSARSASGALKL